MFRNTFASSDVFKATNKLIIVYIPDHHLLSKSHQESCAFYFASRILRTIFCNFIRTRILFVLTSSIGMKAQDDSKKALKNFVSYKPSTNFKILTRLELQSVYDHFPKFQLSWSLCIKVLFCIKYPPNGHRGIGGKLSYVAVNCQLRECFLSE